MSSLKVALLCSGLGNVNRGHEVFATDLFNTLKDHLDIVVFRGGGSPAYNEVIIDHIPRNSECIRNMHVLSSPKWEKSIRESEQLKIEEETFAFACLRHLLEGKFDVIHCLEQGVCNIIYDKLNLFQKLPRVLFSNGGAIPKKKLPRCHFVQEYTARNFSKSDKRKAYMIPHGVDLKKFSITDGDAFRLEHGIPLDAFVVISVGTIGYWHKRMDYVIREVSQLKGAHLVIIGQECVDTPEIRKIANESMGQRVHFFTLAHEELVTAYSAADVFVLGSLFETFGIVYIEAMAMGLPVFCTNHSNQREIVKEGVFVDMSETGHLASALKETSVEKLQDLSKCGRRIVQEYYDYQELRTRYIEMYEDMTNRPVKRDNAGELNIFLKRLRGHFSK